MLSSSPASSSAEGAAAEQGQPRPPSAAAPPTAPLVVVGLSARALAEACRRAGRAVLAVDLFDDADTRAAAAASRRVEGSFAGGPDLAATLAAIDALVAESGLAPAGIVAGSGFEHRPQALAALARRLPLLGAPPAAVEAVKDPAGLAALLARLGVPHPETSLAAPADPENWLAKTAGAAGGHHVRPAAGIAATPGRYFQRRVAGRPLSAAFLADGRRARLLAFCETRTDPAAGAPFRFSGVIGPVPVDGVLAAAVAGALDAIVAATGLSGLCGVDLVADEAGAWWLLEINPRPTAALEVLDRGDAPLIDLHLAAVAGTLPAAWRPPAEPAGTAVVFAPRAFAVPVVAWPDWIADRPLPGTEIGTGEPAVTVRATATTPVSVADKLMSLTGDALRLLIG